MSEKCEKCVGVLSPVLSLDFACRGNASAIQDAHLPGAGAWRRKGT
jgi:hypothetical protein